MDWLFFTYNDYMSLKVEHFRRNSDGVGDFAKTLSHFFNGGGIGDSAVIEAMRGRYALYYPFYGDADYVTISELNCGINGDITRFSIEMRTSYPDGDLDVKKMIVGNMIEQDRTIILQGVLEGYWRGPVIFIMNVFGRSIHPAVRGSRMFLFSPAGYSVSAHPVETRRSDKPVDIGRIRLDMLDDSLLLKDNLKTGFLNPWI